MTVQCGRLSSGDLPLSGGVVLINKTTPVLECYVCWAKQSLAERIASQKIITMYR